MTNICYTLEEAAEKLNLSETVLVRLSQYLKVPKLAYEESGYLSFKGDLTFSDADLAFFTQARQRLLMGDSLDDVKRRMQNYEAQGGAILRESLKKPDALNEKPAGLMPENFQAGLQMLQQESRNRPWQPAGQNDLPIVEDHPTTLFTPVQNIASVPANEPPPMLEMQDRQPYEKAAKKSFERYKSLHRSNLGKIFENMLKEVGTSQKLNRHPDEAIPDYRPVRSKVDASTRKERGSNPHQQEEATRPFQNAPYQPAGLLQVSSASAPPQANAASSATYRKSQPTGAIWNQVVEQAAQKPRGLNLQLKQAAQSLKERTLGEPPSSSHI
jgi:hypothetical protein